MKTTVLPRFPVVLLGAALTTMVACADDTTGESGVEGYSYPVVDSDQTTCYDDSEDIDCPGSNEVFFGQDAQYDGFQPSYTDNGDGTVTDDVTGLMWVQDPGDKQYWGDAVDGADGFSLAGHSDWRVPTIKELQSLVDYDRSPDATDSPAIDPLFDCTEITNEDGQSDFGYYWSSTTHATSNGGAAPLPMSHSARRWGTWTAGLTFTVPAPSAACAPAKGVRYRLFSRRPYSRSAIRISRENTS